MSAALEPQGAIGVGMGGSCPECRGPLDLGQDYCLECGTNVHSRKRVKRVAAVSGAPSATVVRAPGGSGFPWIWFTVLLLLAIAALVSILAYESSGSSTKHASRAPRSTTETTAGVASTPSAASPEVPTTPNFPAGGSATTATPATSGLPGSVNPGGPAVPATGGTPTTPAAGGLPATGAQPVTPGTTGNPVQPATSAGSPVPVNPTHTVPPTNTAPAAPRTQTTPATKPAPPTHTTTAPSTAGPEPWPAGQSGYTIVLGSYGKSLYTESDADQRSAQARQHGLQSGVLDADQFSSLDPGYWDVFSGDYPTKATAQAAVAAAVKGGYESAYVRQVKP